MISFRARLARGAFTLDASFEAGPGITALFGPSGCGKSTVARLIAGIETAEQQRIVIGGRTVADSGAGVAVPPHKRRVGLVFQDAQLFPHLSVKANLAYGRFFTPRAQRRVDPQAVVEVLGIGHLMARRPATLSGGEKQRVAIGRAMLASPRLLVMDEPLAALDAERKAEILPFVARLRDAFAIPIIYISHAPDEVRQLADQVVRLDAGRVTATGAPAVILPRPTATSSSPAPAPAVTPAAPPAPPAADRQA